MSFPVIYSSFKGLILTTLAFYKSMLAMKKAAP